MANRLEIFRAGWMHNRCRMIVAMYLTKDLMLDWRLGEQVSGLGLSVPITILIYSNLLEAFRKLLKYIHNIAKTEATQLSLGS